MPPRRIASDPGERGFRRSDASGTTLILSVPLERSGGSLSVDAPDADDPTGWGDL